MMMTNLIRMGTKIVCILALAVVVAGAPWSDHGGLTVAEAQTQGNVPGRALGNLSDAEMWRAVRKGIRGTVTIPDAKAGQLVQSDGDTWRAAKNGPLAQAGGWTLLAIVIIVALFYLLRGRIAIDGGADPQGRTIERFNALERFTHWLTASSFIILSLTGLNVSYGRYVLKPILGADLFAATTYYGKLAHNYIAFAFMLGIVLMFVLWVGKNIPHMRDIKWLLVGGGLFSKGVHPDAGRFNGGQKIIFWSVVLGGGSLAISGLALMFPYEVTPWAATFKFLNAFGASLPTTLSTLQETQISVLWHFSIGVIMIAIIFGHIYIGSLGMEGAFDAVGTGHIDINWAKQHHNLWVADLEAEESAQAESQPAE